MGRRSRGTDSRIFGPEAWAVIDGVELSHWDLWFLVVMHDLSGGKRELVRLLRGVRRYDGEEKLSHLLDLETRLLAAGLSHEDVLLLVNVDKPLLRKARDKILEQAVGRPSRAMIETPRNLLRDRAMRGHWAKFPFDPAAWECTFGPFCRPDGCYGWRMTPVVVMSMEHAWKLARIASPSAAARVAADRSTLTRIIDLMEHIDDSMAEMAELYKEVLDAYTADVWVAGVEPEVVLRDGIELGIWEDYGLSGEMRMLFRRMPRDDGSLRRTVELEVAQVRVRVDAAHVDPQRLHQQSSGPLVVTLLSELGRVAGEVLFGIVAGQLPPRDAIELVGRARLGGELLPELRVRVGRLVWINDRPDIVELAAGERQGDDPQLRDVDARIFDRAGRIRVATPGPPSPDDERRYVSGHDIMNVAGPERQLALLTEDADARRVPVDLQNHGIDPLGRRRRRFERLTSSVAHDVRARSRVRLTGLELSLADVFLEVLLGGHRRSPRAAPPRPPPSAALRRSRDEPSGGVRSPLPRTRDPAGADPSGFGVGAAVTVRITPGPRRVKPGNRLVVP